MATHEQTRILLVDDDPIARESLADFLGSEGHEVSVAAEMASAVNALTGSRFDLVITDVSTPACDGFELLRHVRKHHAELAVILLAGYGTIESAVEAMKQGAHDYLTKPVVEDDIRQAVRRALQRREWLEDSRGARKAPAGRHGVGHIVTSDARMAHVLALVDVVADSAATVLITGESGTGKSLIARAIHARSPRRDKPFVEVACGAMPDTLLESELFGHMRGAFTHAMADKPGKFTVADGGTIFLDEISTASAQLQVKLLRVLQERKFDPLGSNETAEVDARVILATNHDLWTEVEQGRFRSDLYYRVNVVNIELPPLRERIDDVPLLAEHFLRKYRQASGKSVTGFTPEAMEAMRSYRWGGNVRELENCVERAVLLCRGDQVEPTDLAPAVLKGHHDRRLPQAVLVAGRTLAEAMAEPEKQIIQTALEANNGSRQETARQLGINRTTLYKKMRKYAMFD